MEKDESDFKLCSHVGELHNTKFHQDRTNKKPICQVGSGGLSSLSETCGGLRDCILKWAAAARCHELNGFLCQEGTKHSFIAIS